MTATVHYSPIQFRDPLWTECGRPFEIDITRVVSTPRFVTCGACRRTKRFLRALPADERAMEAERQRSGRPLQVDATR